MLWTLDSALAHGCPVKARLAFTPGMESPPVTWSPPAFVESLRAAASRLTDDFVACQKLGICDLRLLADQPVDERRAATVAAIARGERVIVAATLPADTASHRHGTADVLVRAQDAPNGTPGYLPVQIHGRKILDLRPQGSVRASKWVAPTPIARVLSGCDFRVSRIRDRLELAHLWQLLAALGHASSGRPLGGLIGTDRRGEIAWAELDQPRVPASPRISDGSATVSVMERHLQEFGFRMDTVRAAPTQSAHQPVPIRARECESCRWWDVCSGQLSPDDISQRITKWPLDVHEISALRALGITTVADLAAADLPSVLPLYATLVKHRNGVVPRLEAAARRARMLQAGKELDRVTTGPIRVPGAGLEIDLDIEASSDNRVYLWGFLVHDLDAGADPYYRPFASFTELTEDEEAALASEAMEWLRDLVANRTAAIYHYSDYELVRLAQITSRTPSLDWTARFAKRQFVDLFHIVRKHFFGVHGLGLKNVAHTATSFEWRDPDPGGLNSQRWFDESLHGPDAETRQAAKDRVLAYNEDDVRATWYVRSWLRNQR